MDRVQLTVLIPTLTVAVGADTGSAASSASPAPTDASFLWGVASSGFQSEAYPADSNWSRHSSTGGTPDPYGNSVDFFHRFREDIALARDLGVRVYRMRMEWSRIRPRPGQRDGQGLRSYDTVIDAIRAAGMRPMITVDHWVYPGWAADRGGWRNPGTVADRLTNARFVENGMPTDNGQPRADNLRDTGYWLQRAKADGMNVIGYNYWGLTDNYEWRTYASRFGRHAVDVENDPTLTRRPTDAVLAYRDITANGGVPTGHRPTRPPVRYSVVDPPSSCLAPVAESR